MSRFMVDTNVFNRLVKGVISECDLPSGRYLATHVQRDELGATPDGGLGSALIAKFENIVDNELATESFVLDLSRLDQAKLSHDGSQFDAMLARLVELDNARGKRPQRNNQVRDVLIAETSIKHGVTLLTCDKNLERVTTEFGGVAREP